MKRMIVAGLLAALMVFGIGAVSAQGKRHPNLEAAHNLVLKAMNRVMDAERANEYDMDGHAAKAKDLLQQAEGELKAAAMAANENKKK